VAEDIIRKPATGTRPFFLSFFLAFFLSVFCVRKPDLVTHEISKTFESAPDRSFATSQPFFPISFPSFFLEGCAPNLITSDPHIYIYIYMYIYISYIYNHFGPKWFSWGFTPQLYIYILCRLIFGPSDLSLQTMTVPDDSMVQGPH